ncbi:MAG: hypothetical protein TEF_00355 [Rhizobiales bacterium NRL2]|jgi:methylase of polypeptide subunit release factors|nr:MAG: hypothetical protein TEF_00355 [Rhizobiales bacterium NRL2]
MSQNRSHAVMAQRREPHDSLDFFPTPPWATRALFHHCVESWYPSQTVWDPCCGQGDMARPLSEFFETVHASDVHPYPFVEAAGFLHDFIGLPKPVLPASDWIIANPPFRLALPFILRALELAPFVAIFARLQLLEGAERRERLWLPEAPTRVWVFSERVPIVKNMLDPEASSATAYAWFVWQAGALAQPLGFIPPCRAELERAEDYTPYAEQVAARRAEEAAERAKKRAEKAAAVQQEMGL